MKFKHQAVAKIQLQVVVGSQYHSKKVVHQAHIDNMVNSQRIFKILSLALSGKFVIKNIVNPTTPKTCHYITLCNTNAVQ